ncbi:YafY family protein [Acetobacterium wieringae]|uniref:helix-turn-helix transcriptional regulator n=1 Tax=Acetobacterium wieringae TaxID=52694 RepID=UPI0026EAF004|nr:WYL domain-containing protein [Acetobacterium wieringae]
MGDTKLKLLKILDILKETDENHPLTSNQICEKLKLAGLEASRKAVCSDINILKEYYNNESDEGYEIMLSEDNRKGYYMNSRSFEDWELKVLIDAVWQAKFLTELKSKSLSDRLRMLASAESKKVLQTVISVKSHVKSSKVTVAEHIDMLMIAIRKGRKVKFQYEYTDTNLERHSRYDGKEYLINPYALKWKGDCYYLICNYDKYNNLAHYRLDRIANLCITDMPVKPAKEVVGDNPSLKIEEYISKSMYNYGGEKIRLVLNVKAYMVDVLIDNFGEDLVFKQIGTEDNYEVHVSVNEEDGLYFWLLQHGSNLKVVSPERVRDKLLVYVQDIKELYENV